MVRVTGAWSAAEAASFLESTAVPLRLACRTPSDRLWLLSLWYRYDDGRLRCATSSGADVVSYLRADPHVAFEVSTNEPPYRGVRGNGTASLAPDEDKALLRDLLGRYLGGTDSTLARRLLDPDRDETAIAIEPARLFSWDFAERMRDAVPGAVD